MSSLGRHSAGSGAGSRSFSTAPHLLPTEDADVSAAVEAILREDGIDLLLNAESAHVSGRSGRACDFGSAPTARRTIDGSDLLVATGRVPMTRDVGLDAAGVELTANGFIRVNDRLETTAPDYLGAGGLRRQPAADPRRPRRLPGRQGQRVRRMAAAAPPIDSSRTRSSSTPNWAGSVSPSTKHASRGFDVRVAKRAGFSRSPCPHAGGDAGIPQGGRLTRSPEQILGFAMLGAEAGEVTAVVQMAMLGRLPYTALRDGVLAHPTMAEGLNYLFGAVMK